MSALGAPGFSSSSQFVTEERRLGRVPPPPKAAPTDASDEPPLLLYLRSARTASMGSGDAICIGVEFEQEVNGHKREPVHLLLVLPLDSVGAVAGVYWQ